MIIVNLVAFILVLLGSVNWGLVGIFNWNFVTAIFGPGLNAGSIIVYVLIFISALWLIGAAIYTRGKLRLKPTERDD